MKKMSLDDKLEEEKKKLSRLADESLKNGTPIIEDEAFMAQNRKVDALVVKIQKEKERLKNKQHER